MYKLAGGDKVVKRHDDLQCLALMEVKAVG